MLALLGQSDAARAQPPIDPFWISNSSRLLAITVMVGMTEGGSCSGAGFLSALDGDTAYVVTANHVIATLEERKQPLAVGVLTSVDPRRRAGPPTWYRALATVVRREGEPLDLAVLRIDDPAAVALVAKRQLDQALPATELVAGDHVYAIGCGPGPKVWDFPPQLMTFSRYTRDAHTIEFPSSYVQPGFSGGPLVHVVGRVSLLVGMTLEMGLARDIQHIVEKLHEWKLPIGVRAPGTTDGCRYEVSPRKIALTTENRARATVRIQTDPACRWQVQGDGSSWLNASTSKGAGVGELVFQPLVNESGRPAYDPCRLPSDGARAYVAGVRIDVRWVCPEQLP